MSKQFPFLLLCFLLDCGKAYPDPIIWATYDGERIPQREWSDDYIKKTALWDGKTIRLFGAQNEVLAFQVLVHTQDDPIKRLSLKLPKLAARAGKTTITYKLPDRDPTLYVDRPISLFSLYYLNVVKRTHADWIFPPDSAAEPKTPLGFLPVQIVPENAREGVGSFPLRIDPNQNQAFWIELYLRRDLPAGVYDGEVEVLHDSRTTKLPIELTIFDFALPDTNSLNTMIYYEKEQVERYHGKDRDEAYQRFAHRNRVEFVHIHDQPFVEKHRDRFSGEFFIPKRGYEGPGERTGVRIAPRTFYDVPKEWEKDSYAQAQALDWMSFLQKNVPNAITFLYMPDEPSKSVFPFIRNVAKNVHQSPSPGNRLPIFITHKYDPDLAGAIDFWCATPYQYDNAFAEKERAQGNDFCFYNGGRPHVGSILIDSPGTDARVAAWAAFKHGVTTYFYWHANHWRHNRQKKIGDRNQDVWNDPITFQPLGSKNAKWYANGDGVLVYPGEEAVHATENRGIAGPISTLQMANFRRGAQDHLYLTLARRKGLSKLVETSLDKIAPRVLSDAGPTVSFPETSETFEQVRYELGKAIEGASSEKWAGVYKENFETLNDFGPGKWMPDTYPDDGPFADNGKYFRDQKILPPKAYRRTSTFGKNGWLILESYSRSPNGGLTPHVLIEPDPSDAHNRVLKLQSPVHTDATVIRPTRPLPPSYRVSLRVGFPEFGDGKGPPNGYSGPVRAEPWLDRNAQEQNGFYWLTILDSVPRPHNNVWIHHHRKVVIDSDNHYPPWMEIFHGKDFVKSGVHPVMMFALDGKRPIQTVNSGKPFISYSNNQWQPSGRLAAVDAYLPKRWYQVQITRADGKYEMRVEGEFEFGGKRVYEASIPVAAVAGEGLPDYFMFGDPHNNYYEGWVFYDDITLEVPEKKTPTEVGVSQ